MAFNLSLGQMAGIGMQLMAGSVAMDGAKARADILRTSGEIAAQGALFTAAGFRQSADTLGQANQFNLQVDQINHLRTLQATGRQYQRLLGKQLGQQARTGLNINSKSFLMTRAEGVDMMSRALINLKVDAENTRRAKIFETEIRQTNLENQARGAEYQAAADRDWETIYC